MRYYTTFQKKLVIGLILTLAGVLFVGFVVFGATILEDDFNSYPDGDLNGQGTPNAWTGSTAFDVQGNVVFEGSKAVQSSLNANIDRTGTIRASGEIVIYVRSNKEGQGAPSTGYNLLENGSIKTYLLFNQGNGKITFREKGTAYWIDVRFEPYNKDTWYALRTQWTGTGSNSLVRYQIDEEGWTEWVEPFDDWTSGLNQVRLETWDVIEGYTGYFDYIAEKPKEAEFKIWGISPASSTEITESGTEFTFGYQGFSSTTWDGILINFCSVISGICADEKMYPKADLDVNGEKTLTFENFNFDGNGDWYLIGDAYFHFFTTDWKWVIGFTGDVVSPYYYIKINFEGLPTIFEIQEPTTWYSTHTEYATPTAFFSSISDLSSPFFSKIGEFGSRITTFFNQNEALSRGKNIGSILPIFKLYIEQFEFLFGGFPLISVFILAMVFLMGFFLFKIVFKIIRG